MGMGATVFGAGIAANHTTFRAFSGIHHDETTDLRFLSSNVL